MSVSIYHWTGSQARIRLGALTTAILLFVWASTASAVPVIPDAKGFGMNTPAGRGGVVYRVTNLNETGTGSLSACVKSSGPRVCVFEVSGVIRLTQDLGVNNPYLTIAGQTAPSPGIMIRGGAIWIATSDVLIQHITIRVGDDSVGPNPNTRKSLKISSTGSVNNVVIDHCTFSWGIDETAQLGWADFDNVSFNNNIVSEGLNYSVLHDWSGYGTIIGGYAGKARISMMGNLYAHNMERNPLSNAQGFVFVNNVVYNPGSSALMLTGEMGATSSSVVGNLFVHGPDTGKPYSNGDYVGIHGDAVDGSRVYLADNALLTSYNSPQEPLADQWSRVYFMSGKAQASFRVDAPPVWLSGLTPMPVANVRASVLAKAGSRPADRSAKDKEIIADVMSGTGNIVNCVSASNCRAAPYNKDAGGWPVYAQNVRSLTLPASPNDDSDGDGYTNLEEWLHAMAADVEGAKPLPKPPQSVIAQ